MTENILQIRLFLSSPGDVPTERSAVKSAVDEINDLVGKPLQARIELLEFAQIAPELGRTQEIINRGIGPYDVFLGIMAKRFGTPTGHASSGTQEEFEIAHRTWEKDKSFHVMFYFLESANVRTKEELDQYAKVLAFRERLSQLGLVCMYNTPEAFYPLVKKHLSNVFHDFVEKHRAAAVQSHSVEAPRAASAPETVPPQRDIETLLHDSYESLRLPISGEHYSSFVPGSSTGRLVRLEVPTTPGYNASEARFLPNSVYIVRDPIRPYVIQIGESRAKRKVGNPETVPELLHMDIESLREMYPFICGDRFKWLRMVIAELSTSDRILDHLYRYDSDSDVRKLAARNPSASAALMSRECLFCDANFAHARRLPENQAESRDTFIIRNDFPYGPHFHYIAIPRSAIHSWEDFTEPKLRDMNNLISRHLHGKLDHAPGQAGGSSIEGACGVHVGFNSTTRHLVLTRHSRASAGASIAHVHKQVWGMVRGGFNLGDHAIRICAEFEHQGRDYLAEYLRCLDDAGFVVWRDENVCLYVPFGQMSVHELQLMVLRPGCSSYTHLTEAEISSLSRAEYLAIQIFRALGISSFNEIVLTDKLKASTATFRLILAFVTREIDIAVSELNHLYVVDKHPQDTRDAIATHRSTIERTSGLRLKVPAIQPGLDEPWPSVLAPA